LSIEEKIKELPTNACRVCEHFCRVNFEGYDNIMNRQGFCILGQLEGDFGLYLSSSKSRDCLGYLYSERNAKIYNAEHELDIELDDYIESLSDRRTTNWKEIEPLLRAHTDFFEKYEAKPKGLAFLDAEIIIRRFACKYFREMHIEKYREVYHMVSLKRIDFQKFLAKLSVEIHNQFCECQNIEFKDSVRVPDSWHAPNKDRNNSVSLEISADASLGDRKDLHKVED